MAYVASRRNEVEEAVLQPQLVVVSLMVAPGASAAPASCVDALGAWSMASPVPSHSALHLLAAHAASALRALFVAQRESASLFFRHK